MPKRKQPSKLYALSIRCIAETVAYACNKLAGKKDVRVHVHSIYNFVQKIPEHAADSYVLQVLNKLNGLRHSQHLRAALHPQCTKLEMIEFEIPNQTIIALFQNLDAVSQVRQLLICTTLPASGSVQQAFTSHICNFHVLTTLTLMYFLCSSGMLRSIAENCCNLEFLYIDRDSLQDRDVRMISSCSKLKNLTFRPTTECVTTDDAVHFLNTLPDLEFLNIKDLMAVLENLSNSNFSGSYGLKSFSGWANSSQYNCLDLVDRFFPKLEKFMVRTGGNLNILDTFSRLRILYVSRFLWKTENGFVELPLECSSRLTELHLGSVDVSRMFKTELGVTFPVMNALYLFRCKDVDIPAIAVQCPKLKSLAIDCCTASANPLPKLESDDRLPFSPLKSLHLRYIFSLNHLYYLLISCRDLQVLFLSVGHKFGEEIGKQGLVINEMVGDTLLHVNPLKMLESLSIDSNAMKKSVLQGILSVFGNLNHLSLQGSQMNFLVSEYDEIRYILQSYDMNCYIQGQLVYPV